MTAQSASAILAELRFCYDRANDEGSLDAYRKRRWGGTAEFAPWLEQDALATLEPAQALRLYRASGGRDAVGFSSNPIEEVRDSLDFLLYDTIKLEGRFDECVMLGGAYELNGAGKEFVSWLLCLRSPSLLGLWNSNAERLLRRVGAYPDSMKRGPAGIRYLDLLEALGWLRVQLGLPDFIEVDAVSYLSARTRRKGLNPGETENTERKNALA